MTVSGTPERISQERGALVALEKPAENKRKKILKAISNNRIINDRNMHSFYFS